MQLDATRFLPFIFLFLVQQRKPHGMKMVAMFAISAHTRFCHDCPQTRQETQIMNTYLLLNPVPFCMHNATKKNGSLGEFINQPVHIVNQRSLTASLSIAKSGHKEIDPAIKPTQFRRHATPIQLHPVRTIERERERARLRSNTEQGPQLWADGDFARAPRKSSSGLHNLHFLTMRHAKTDLPPNCDHAFVRGQQFARHPVSTIQRVSCI